MATLLGHLPRAVAGEFIEARGRWVVDRQHGQQFKAEFIRITPPTTLEGIGPYFAAKLVEAFGEQVFDVVESMSERLTEIPGIGTKRRERIATSWRGHVSLVCKRQNARNVTLRSLDQTWQRDPFALRAAPRTPARRSSS